MSTSGAIVATLFPSAPTIATVTWPVWRSLIPTAAWLVGQSQTGENSREIPVTEIGLFSSFRCSVIAKAAEVATSRPRSVTVVTTRRKARRFYGPLVKNC